MFRSSGISSRNLWTIPASLNFNLLDVSLNFNCNLDVRKRAEIMKLQNIAQ